MAKFDDKLSNLINQQAPDFVLDDHPYFLEFVKAYYSFMESAELTLTNIGDPDVIQLDNTRFQDAADRGNYLEDGLLQWVSDKLDKLAEGGSNE